MGTGRGSRPRVGSSCYAVHRDERLVRHHEPRLAGAGVRPVHGEHEYCRRCAEFYVVEHYRRCDGVWIANRVVDSQAKPHVCIDKFVNRRRTPAECDLALPDLEAGVALLVALPRRRRRD